MLPKILMAADHGGFARKQTLKKFLQEKGYTVQDCGAYELDPSDDYPLIVKKLAATMRQLPRESTLAILLCRSGAGMSMAANRFSHLRAVTAVSAKQAQHARNDNNANVISLSADWLGQEELQTISLKFLTTPFSQEKRHIRRVRQLSLLTDNKI